MKFLAYGAGLLLALGGILWTTTSWIHQHQEAQARLVEGLPLPTPTLPSWVTTLRGVSFIMLLLGAAGAVFLVALLLRAYAMSRKKETEESPQDFHNSHEQEGH